MKKRFPAQCLISEITSELNECKSRPCVNGRCLDGNNDYVCVCEAGFTGKDCELGKLMNL